MQPGDELASFLVGRLVQEGHSTMAVLRVCNGRVAIPGNNRVLAVTGGRLWLAAGQLFGPPTMADVPLTSVTGVDVQPGSRRRLVLWTTEATLRFTITDDDAACTAFVQAVRRGRQDGTASSG